MLNITYIVFLFQAQIQHFPYARDWFTNELIYYRKHYGGPLLFFIPWRRRPPPRDFYPPVTS